MWEVVEVEKSICADEKLNFRQDACTRDVIFHTTQTALVQPSLTMRLLSCEESRFPRFPSSRQTRLCSWSAERRQFPALSLGGPSLPRPPGEIVQAKAPTVSELQHVGHAHEEDDLPQTPYWYHELRKSNRPAKPEVNRHFRNINNRWILTLLFCVGDEIIDFALCSCLTPRELWPSSACERPRSYFNSASSRLFSSCRATWMGTESER